MSSNAPRLVTLNARTDAHCTAPGPSAAGFPARDDTPGLLAAAERAGCLAVEVGIAVVLVLPALFLLYFLAQSDFLEHEH